MSSSVWPIIFIAGFLLAIFILTNFRSIVPLRLSRSRIPGLKKRSTGKKYGTYSIKFYPDREAIAVQTALQGGSQTNADLTDSYAKMVVFFTSLELFYYGNGVGHHDTSGPLREEVRKVLNNPDELTWTIVEWDRYEKPLFRYEGELFRNALSLPGILGIEARPKDLSLVQSVKALVGYTVNETPNLGGTQSNAQTNLQSRLVRHAVTQLLNWHDQFGPPSDMSEAQDRAAQAWETALGAVHAAA